MMLLHTRRWFHVILRSINDMMSFRMYRLELREQDEKLGGETLHQALVSTSFHILIGYQC